jgi:antitoxin MazE
MVSKVMRWGHGLGIRIPQEVVDRLQLREGESVRVQVREQAITISRAKPRKKWTEAELLKGITPVMCRPDLIPDRAGKERI